MMISLFDGEQIPNACTKEKVEEGRAEGEKQQALETAKKMLSKATPSDLIAEPSSLPLSEIDALKAQITR